MFRYICRDPDFPDCVPVDRSGEPQVHVPCWHQVQFWAGLHVTPSMDEPIFNAVMVDLVHRAAMTPFVQAFGMTERQVLFYMGLASQRQPVIEPTAIVKRNERGQAELAKSTDEAEGVVITVTDDHPLGGAAAWVRMREARRA